MGGLPIDFCSKHKVPAAECFSEHYPDAHVKIGWPAWTVQVNDLIGGWAVTTYPYPMSEHDFRVNGDQMKCGYILADCMVENDAIMVAMLLNLNKYVPKDIEKDLTRWRWVEVGYLEGSLRNMSDVKRDRFG